MFYEISLASVRHQKSWKKCHYFQDFLSAFTFGKYAELFIFRICSQTVVKTLQTTTQNTTQNTTQKKGSDPFGSLPFSFPLTH